MVLSPGDRLGPYDIAGSLGAGGMGEVYRARDLKLGRDVALKILPPLVATDPDRLARFQREAQILASLNHPQIAAIYGIEDSAAGRALVLELVEGPTLADRIGEGPVPLDDALPIARQICDALEAAHACGIVHRDLKPANIKVRVDGAVKVLDFGLAKAVEPAVTTGHAGESPTITSPAVTQLGVIVGTASYMSPEQAQARPADKRSDIWAFGCVVYEMLTARRAFEGENVTETLAFILTREPDWSLLPSSTPPAIKRLLRRCLAKQPHERLHDIVDARLELEDVSKEAPIHTAASPGRVRTATRLAWLTAIVAAAALTGALAAWNAMGRGDVPELRVEVSTPPTSNPPSFAISFDGRMLVFNADGPRGGQLWLRSLDNTTPRPLAGTEGGQFPFWSPDGRSIGFFADNKLKRVSVDGGRPQPVANVLTPAGGTWSRNGTILYVPDDSRGVFRIPATGGEPREVISGGSHQLATRVPQWLPDDRHFLYYVARGADGPGVWVGDTGGDPPRRLIDADFGAQFGGGLLLFVRDGALSAQRFDSSRQILSGVAARVAGDVAGGLIGAAFSVSGTGTIAYRALPGTFAERRLAWFDRTGKELGVAGEPGAYGSNPSLSPDDRRVVLQRTVDNNIDIWEIDLERNIATKVTFDPGIEATPLWSRDGRRIVFSSAMGGATGSGIWRIKYMDGSRADEPVQIAGNEVKIPCDWSPDGHLILFKQFDQATSTTDLWVLPIEGNGPPTPIMRTPSYNERDGEFSPDGKWVAYTSDESGQPEIYLQPFPGPGAKVRVSTAGGEQVRWRRDGAELFYVARDTYLMSVPLNLAGGHAAPANPVRLFKTRIATTRSISRQQYAVARDGHRFLIMTAAEFPPTPITLILNWRAPQP